MHQTDDHVAWPDKVITLMAESPWLQKSANASHRPHLDKVITFVNLLDLDQRRGLREDGQEVVNKFFNSLTPEEQKLYVDSTMERYFEVISRGLKLMTADERKRTIGRLRNDMKNVRGTTEEGDRLLQQDQEFLEFILAEDPILILREMPTKAKMELAPVIEGLTSRLQQPGMRR